MKDQSILVKELVRGRHSSPETTPTRITFQFIKEGDLI